MITDSDVSTALFASARPDGDGWRFWASDHRCTEKEARQIVRIHLLLGIEPISSTLTSALFLTLVERVIVLENAVHDTAWRREDH